MSFIDRLRIWWHFRYARAEVRRFDRGVAYARSRIQAAGSPAARADEIVRLKRLTPGDGGDAFDRGVRASIRIELLQHK